ncbi:MAG TPA: hypothetical protein VLL27_09390 [Solirubrobacterales bacterium]|nr:hypothetical protein [Solirubrobacterales bacterium]
MSKRLTVALLGALVVALLAAGCGGGDDSSGDSSESTDSGSSSSLTKAEFIKQGDEICKQGDAAIEGEANEFAKENNIDTAKPTEAQKEEVYSQVIGPALKQQSEEIADLGPPEGEEEAVEDIVEAVGRGADEIEEDPKSVLNGGDPLAEATKLAKAYGFKQCGGAG